MEISMKSSSNPITKVDYNNSKKSDKGNQKFSVNNDIINNKKNNDTKEKVTTNVKKRSSTLEDRNFSYFLGGKRIYRTSTYQRALGEFDKIFHNRENYIFQMNGVKGNLKKEVEKEPTYEVDKVVQLNEVDYMNLYENTCKNGLNSNLKERGVYKNKKYFVLDKIRYETIISKSKAIK